MVQRGPAAGLLAQLVVLVVLATTAGLDPLGWAAGLGYGTVTYVALGVHLDRHHRGRLGPADRVTLTRAVVVGGVTALVVTGSPRVPVLVALVTAALLLDRVDGEVARRTGTASGFGAAFDMEVDAFLILVLSGYVAGRLGTWVLLIGAARYALWVAGWLLPWLRASVPPRPWAKVVAAVQGIVLAVAAAGVLPRAVTVALVAAALLLLAESFGHQVLWLRTHRTAPARVPVGAAG